MREAKKKATQKIQSSNEESGRNLRRRTTRRISSKDSKESEPRELKSKQQIENEALLFGNSPQGGTEEANANPLLAQNKRVEAQTEIIKNRIQFSDEEDIENSSEQKLVEQLDTVQEQKPMEIIDEAKLKDMGLLFGMPEEEVQAIA